VIKAVAALLAAGLLLSACGSQSEAKAMNTWVRASSFHQNTQTLTSDIRHSATALENSSNSARVLHLVCDVLSFDNGAANAALPTPDSQSTALLAKAYTDIGGGANTCFVAGASSTLRNKALGYLRKGLGELTEGVLRVDAATGTP
jgi:hypothetical protein